MTAPDPQTLYTMLGRLLAEPPDLSSYLACNSPETQEWLGKAYAISEASGSLVESTGLRAAQAKLAYASWGTGVKEIFASIYRTFAVLELRSPPALAGTFIPVGSHYDAFAALSKVLKSAQRDVLIVDPYMDDTTLNDFGATVPEGVQLRLLTDEATYKQSLAPAALRWVQQHADTRPLEVRLATPRQLHDRVIFVDGTTAWTLTQSLKDFAKRSPAEIIKAQDTAALKIQAYGDIWKKSRPLS